MIINHEKVEIHNWNKFIELHADSTIFHTPYMFNVYKVTPNHEPFALFVEDDNHNIQAMLSGYVQTVKPGLLAALSKRAVMMQSPIFNSKEDLNLLLKGYNEFIKDKAIYTEIRNHYDTNNFREVFLNSGYSYEEHLNILVDLTKTEVELWSEVQSKRRNEIRRAEKEGTEFQLSNNRTDVSETYKILKEVYSRARLPMPDAGFFLTAFDKLGQDHFRVFIALNKGKIIGTMYTLCYNDIIYDWYAGSYQEYYQKCPNDLIPWKVFLWGKENGYKKFDFGGAGKPGVPYGVRDYKKKFGGTFVNYGRYEKIHNRALMKLGLIGFRIYKMVKL